MTARKWRSPALLLAVLLVLALASLGLGYGLWSKTLTIDGTVETGSVDAVWFYASCTETEDKPVGEFTVEPDPLDQEILLVTIGNGYPSYYLDCEVHFANSGSMPLKIRAVSLPSPNPAPDVTVTLIDGIGAQLEPCGFTPRWDTHPLDVPAECQQASSLLLHIEQEADQNAGRGQVGDPLAYQFGFKICLAQWNESPTAAECFAAAP